MRRSSPDAFGKARFESPSFVFPVRSSLETEGRGRGMTAMCRAQRHERRTLRRFRQLPNCSAQKVLEFYRDLVDLYGYRFDAARALDGGRKAWAPAQTGIITSLRSDGEGANGMGEREG